MKNRLLFIMCSCMLVLTSCWDRVEMQDLAIITAAAMDLMDDGQTRISVQLFIPRAIASGETGEDPGQGNTFVREAIGDNLANAISMLQVNVPRRLFWGQCKVYIFGNALAESGIREEIDYLARQPGPRGTSFLYVTEGEGMDILQLVPPLERYSGEALKRLTEAELGISTTLRDVDMGLMGEGESVSIPFIKKLVSEEPARKPHETIPIIEGTAVFKKDQMVGTLNMKETRGLLWLEDEVKRSTISIKLEGEEGKITMMPTLGKVKYSPQIKDEKWIMKLNITIEGDIVQNETHLNLMNDDILDDVKKEYEKALEDRISLTIEKLQQEFHTDVIDFGKRFHQKYPKEWKEVKDNWDEKFQEVEVDINVRAKVRRPGYIGPPAALPRDEVKE